jgi:hypothetical protein
MMALSGLSFAHLDTLHMDVVVLSVAGAGAI